MRWISLACCFLYSPLALAVQAHSSSSLLHDGYRLQELSVSPARQPLSAGDAINRAGCGAFPAAPAPAAGKLEVVPLVKDRFFNKFFQGGGRLYRLVTQQQGEPRAIVVHSGGWTLPRLVEALKGQPDVLLRQGGNYLLRVPLLLEAGSSLVVSEGESLRLSRERGAFIISMGTLHLRKARLEGWDDARGKPVEMADDGASFEPFVVGWSGARILISDSTVTGLGFGENLAQGVTLAVGPQGLAGYTLPPPAQANIQDSHFEGMYSAIHATATPDLRLCRNQFVGSRLHAIHLDDGSSGLILRNRVTATRGAYGLYFNKGVSNVQVLENDISENNRSGISISDSRDILLARNEIRQNFDAVYLQDADQVFLADNRILDNQRHGLSVRNVGRIQLQGDRIGPNQGVGILARSEASASVPKSASPPPTTQHYSRFVALAQAAQPAAAVSSTLGVSRAPGDSAASGASSGKGVSAAPDVSTAPYVTGSPEVGIERKASGIRGGEDRMPGEDVVEQKLRQASVPLSPALAGVAGRRAGDAEELAAPMAWAPGMQRIEMLGVTLEGNHSSALAIERPYGILLHKVSVMYPGVRRRPVFRGVLNYFESDILRRLTQQKTLLVAPGSSSAAGAVTDAGKREKAAR